MRIRFGGFLRRSPIPFERPTSASSSGSAARINEPSGHPRRSAPSLGDSVREQPSIGSWKQDRRSVLRGYSLVILAVASCALGGGAEVWAQGVLALAVAAMLLLFPPGRSLGRRLNFIFIALAALPLTAFLPTSWTGRPAWQGLLPNNFPTSLGALRTPQPWMTIEGVLSLWLALSVAYAALSHRWSEVLRPRAIRIYAFGIFSITLVFIWAYATRVHIPFWPLETQFYGFFGNHDVTSHIMAIAGIMSCAVAVQDFQQGRAKGVVWLMPLPVILYALICNYSRAGIILFFGGIVAFLVWSAFCSSPRRPAIIGLNAALFLLGLFFVFGGQTLRRFSSETLAPFSHGKDFRIQLHQDALALSMKSPLLGIGSGDFGSVFQMTREASASQYQALQPESDWLWTAVELGWIAPVLLFCGGVLYLRRCLPLEHGTHACLRIAAIVTSLAFALHSLYCVPAHHLGAVFSALFLASAALHPRHTGIASRSVGPFFRILGAVIALVGAWWLASAAGAKVFPTRHTVELLKKQVQLASARQDFEQMISRSTDLLRLTPLDAEAHSDRARAYALTHNLREADAAFAAARALRPVSIDLCLREGNVWYSLEEWPRCRVAWEAALRRDPAGAPQLYSRLLANASGNIAARDVLREWAHRNSEMLLTYVSQAGPVEFQGELKELLSADPELARFNPDQLARFFQAWSKCGDQSWMVREIRKRPAWQAAGWRWSVQDYVAERNFEAAYRTAIPHIAEPRLPSVRGGSLIEIRQRWLLFPDDIVAAYQLYSRDAASGDSNEALTVLWKVTAMAGCPSYFHYLKAQMLARGDRWEEALSALRAYAANLDRF